MEPKYKRIMLKISGEALAGEKGFGLDQPTINKIAAKIKECYDLGVEISIVIGGGNFWRGRNGEEMDRTRADHMGMLATVINSLAMLDALEHLGVECRVQTAIEMRQIAEPYIRLKAASASQKRQGCNISAAERVIRSFRPIRRRLCVLRRLTRKLYCLPKRLTAYMTATPTSIPTPKKFDKPVIYGRIQQGS